VNNITLPRNVLDDVLPLLAMYHYEGLKFGANIDNLTTVPEKIP